MGDLEKVPEENLNSVVAERLCLSAYERSSEYTESLKRLK